MKKVLFLTASFLVFTLFFACNGTQKKEHSNENRGAKQINVQPGAVEVYYFHGSIRCETCVAVDEHTHQYLIDLFPDKMKSGDIVFQSINIDENERPDLIKKYQIYGQTLLVIKGDKVIDLTDKAFQYVTTNPEKWKRIVKETVQKLIG